MPSSAGKRKPSVSILIMTLNEEDNIGPCIDSVSWSNDIVVFDSGSKDRTVPLARKRGARIVTRKLDNWAAHQNWALDHIRFKNPWVFFLDADERVPADLREEILKVIEDPDRLETSFFAGRRNFFFGKWIKHCYPPGWNLKLFKPACVRFERLVNPIAVIKGPRGYLKHYYDHYNFSKGFEEWFDKHNRYSTNEAQEGLKGGTSGFTLRPLLAMDKILLRMGSKRITTYMPFKPLIKFFWIFVIKGGFLDGREGLTYCVLQSIYEYLISIKLREFNLRSKGLRP
jgi:glycosyltransferase involved in cell wall biosynthesis